jgi:uncharacterized protein (DUF885 family)
MLVAAPHQTMDADAKEAALSTNNRHFIRAITHHEMIPGHHLQLWMAQRHHPHRELFRTPFFVEGWTLHWEMVMWEKGFARGPEDRIGMMFWRMHRAARIVVSLRFHREEMTPNEMVETLVEQVGFELDAAKGEVRRFIGDDYPPLYQCAYLIGGYQMHALYREMLSRGWSEKEFHDQALRQGSIPIALLRQLFLGEPISLDEAPRWRFEDPPAYEEPS